MKKLIVEKKSIQNTMFHNPFLWLEELFVTSCKELNTYYSICHKTLKSSFQVHFWEPFVLKTLKQELWQNNFTLPSAFMLLYVHAKYQKTSTDRFVLKLFKSVLRPCCITSSKKSEDFTHRYFLKTWRTSFWAHFVPFCPKTPTLSLFKLDHNINSSKKTFLIVITISLWLTE